MHYIMISVRYRSNPEVIYYVFADKKDSKAVIEAECNKLLDKVASVVLSSDKWIKYGTTWFNLADVSSFKVSIVSE